MTGLISSFISAQISIGLSHIEIVRELRKAGHVVPEIESLKEFTRIRKLLTGGNIK